MHPIGNIIFDLCPNTITISDLCSKEQSTWWQKEQSTWWKKSLDKFEHEPPIGIGVNLDENTDVSILKSELFSLEGEEQESVGEGISLSISESAQSPTEGMVVTRSSERGKKMLTYSDNDLVLSIAAHRLGGAKAEPNKSWTIEEAGLQLNCLFSKTLDKPQKIIRNGDSVIVINEGYYQALIKLVREVAQRIDMIDYFRASQIEGPPLEEPELREPCPAEKL